MKLTSKEAKEIVESYRGKTVTDKWIEHCICVGDTAGKIAKALEESRYNRSNSCMYRRIYIYQKEKRRFI